MDFVGKMITTIHADICLEQRLREELDKAIEKYNKDLIPDKHVMTITKREYRELKERV